MYIDYTYIPRRSKRGFLSHFILDGQRNVLQRLIRNPVLFPQKIKLKRGKNGMALGKQPMVRDDGGIVHGCAGASKKKTSARVGKQPMARDLRRNCTSRRMRLHDSRNASSAKSRTCIMCVFYVFLLFGGKVRSACKCMQVYALQSVCDCMSESSAPRPDPVFSVSVFGACACMSHAMRPPPRSEHVLCVCVCVCVFVFLELSHT